MDLVALKYFAEAVRQGGITKAAEHLHVAQPALSRQIRLLEEELGVKLLERHRRGVKPTRDGLSFVQGAENLLRQAQQLRHEVGSRVAEPVGSIRLGFLPATSELLVGKLIAEFVREFPKVTFHLQEGYTPELAEAMIANKLDLAIMSYEFKHQDLDRTPLFTEHMWLAGLPSIWPFGDSPLDLAQLSGLPLLHSQFAGGYLSKLSSARKIQLRSMIVGDTRSVIRHTVQSGSGFVLMPASSIMNELESGEIRGAPIKSFKVHRALFRRIDAICSRAIAKFEERLLAAVETIKREKSPLIQEFSMDLARSGRKAGAKRRKKPSKSEESKGRTGHETRSAATLSSKQIVKL